MTPKKASAARGEQGLKNFHIKENWVIEVGVSGNAKVEVTTNFMNILTEDQVLASLYEFVFRKEEKPSYFRCEGKLLSPKKGTYTIPLNETIKSFQKKDMTIEMGYTELAKAENDWCVISLNPRHGPLSPHELTIECYLPMETEDIKVRNTVPHLIDQDNKKVTLTFPGTPYFLKLAYKLKKARQSAIKSSVPVTSLSGEEMERIRNSMPLLCSLSNTFSRELKHEQHFHGKTFLIALHFLKDLIVFLEACEKLGLDPAKTYLFWKPYLYPHKDLIASYLKTRGYENIYPLEKLESVLENLDQQNSFKGIIVLEDGGYIVPSLHYKFTNLLKKTIGAVEQTTKGIRNDEKLPNIAIPIFNVAEANIKMRIEPPYVADAVIQNIKNLLSFEKLRGEKVALMGCGVVGKEIREKLRSEGMRVTVYDLKNEIRMEARDKGYDVEREPYNAVKDKFLVIGCSGQTSITRKEILSLRHKTYLVSASSDQIEIDISTLETLSKGKQPLKDSNGNLIGNSYVIREKDYEVRLLANGYPINFWRSESMPNQVSDLVLSIIFLSALELVIKKNPKGIQNVDEIVSEYKVGEIYEDYYLE